MINPYSFANSGRNSSFMSNNSFGVKPPATFGEYMKRLFQKFIGWIQTGWSVSKNIVWGASIGKIELQSIHIRPASSSGCRDDGLPGPDERYDSIRRSLIINITLTCYEVRLYLQKEGEERAC